MLPTDNTFLRQNCTKTL